MTRPRDRLCRKLRAAFRRHASTVLVADRAVTFTGADLEVALDRWQEAIDREIPEGGYVGVLATPTATQAAAILMVLASGRVPVPLNPWTPASRPQAAGADLHGLICAGVEAGRLSPRGPVVTLDPRGAITGRQPAAPGQRPPTAPEAAGLVLHTSGSTGAPKRVLLAAEGLLTMIDELIRRFALGTGTVAAVVQPLYHTTALNTQLLPTVCAGGRTVVSSSRWLMGRVYRDVLDSGATFVSLVNELLGPSLEEKRRRGLPAATSVAEVQLAGSTSQPQHLAMARELFPAARIHRCYGLTEAIRVAMIASDEPGFDGAASGRVLPGQKIEIRDPEGEPLGPGIAGEIWVRGPSVMLGYLDGDVVSPLEGGWLATGDLGTLTDDGRLVVEGRRDRVFKSYGHRIAPAEIEGAALALPALADARCIAVPCPDRGRRPPKDVVVVAALPRTALGKVDLAALDRLWTDRPGAAELGRGPAGCRFTALASDPAERPP